MTRISAPHRGHTSGSVSYTRRIRSAHRRLRAARSGVEETVASETSLEGWASSGVSAYPNLRPDCYNITSEGDFRDAVEKVAAYVEALPTERKIAVMGAEHGPQAPSPKRRK